VLEIAVQCISVHMPIYSVVVFEMTDAIHTAGWIMHMVGLLCTWPTSHGGRVLHTALHTAR